MNLEKRKELTTEEMCEVMQAHRNGAEIEYKRVGCVGFSRVFSPMWNWENYIYRVKPKLEYKVLDSEDIADLVGKVIVFKQDKTRNLVLGNINNEIIIAENFYEGGTTMINSTMLLGHWEHLDGSPIGKLK